MRRFKDYAFVSKNGEITSQHYDEKEDHMYPLTEWKGIKELKKAYPDIVLLYESEFGDFFSTESEAKIIPLITYTENLLIDSAI